eukprot:8210586-Alexandrium_andersonii.AAC.1
MPDPWVISDSQAADLAGNAFAGTIATALCTAILAAWLPVTAEDDEAADAAALFLQSMASSATHSL